ncbi:MAG: hypothetical protein QOG30_2856 [Acidimicrobiaceae bacterium]
MITIPPFSEAYGRLGNQMFHLGLLFAVSQRRGYDFYLPHAGESLWKCFDLDVPDSGPECTHRFDESRGWCMYDPDVFEQPDGTGFHGFFQSYRYLEDCRESYLKLLQFNVRHRALCEASLFAYRRRSRRPLASIHVRRGDYVSPGDEDKWGDLAGDGYYRRAVEAIGDDVTYLVFSDDLAWCRESLCIEGAEYADFDQFTSLCLMSRCDVNIIANSSFSWWAAYLNPTADVYAPKKWFGPAMPPPDDRQADIVLPSWRTIPTFTS